MQKIINNILPTLASSSLLFFCLDSFIVDSKLLINWYQSLVTTWTPEENLTLSSAARSMKLWLDTNPTSIRCMALYKLYWLSYKPYASPGVQE